MSDEDIDIGQRWNFEISSELNYSGFGVICLTPENQDKPWINFEAGALSKSIQTSQHSESVNDRVCPFLIDMKKSDLTGPLTQFQIALADKEGTLKLAKSLNTTLESNGENYLTPESLLESFEVWWPKLDEQLTIIKQIQQVTIPSRADIEIIEELLERVRNIERRVESANLNSIQPPSATDDWYFSVEKKTLGEKQRMNRAYTAVASYCESTAINPRQFFLLKTPEIVTSGKYADSWLYEFTSTDNNHKLFVLIDRNNEAEVLTQFNKFCNNSP